jgi:hypothetical protein
MFATVDVAVIIAENRWLLQTRKRPASLHKLLLNQILSLGPNEGTGEFSCHQSKKPSSKLWRVT